MLVVLVHQGDVEEHVLLLGQHPPQPVGDDDRDLVGVRRVVGHAVGDHRGEHVAVTVLVLQSLAVERGAAGRPAEQEAAGPRVPGRPDQVHDPLEAEHRVEDVERDHRDVAGAVGGRGGDPRRHRAGLVDALLQHLAVRRLAVVHQLVGVLGLVELTGLAEDAELAEHALHPERPGLIRHDRHHARADGLVPQQRVQDPDERHGGGDLPARRAAQLAAERAQLRHSQRLRRPPPPGRQVPAEGGPAVPAGRPSPRCRRRSAGTAARPAARRTAAG